MENNLFNDVFIAFQSESPQVVEAKRFEGVFFVEKCAEFKNQTVKKSAGTQKCYTQRNTPG